MTITLENSRTARQWHAAPAAVQSGQWQERTVSFSGDFQDAFADELRFTVPNGSSLFLDDVLLFEPAE